MELEFDKEIDAILRKAERGSPVDTGVALVGTHLDADELAAFAENAIPDRTRQSYIAHLADCDTCRKMFSSFISMYPEAAPPEAAFDAVAPAVKIPWYRSMLAIPNLAYVMGTLVLLFSGIIGYLVLQNRNAESGTAVSKVTEQKPVAPALSTEDKPQEFSNASSTSSVMNANVSSPIDSVTKSGVAVGTSGNGEPANEPIAGKDEVATNLPADEPRKEAPATATTAQQPPAKPAIVATERDDKKVEAKTDEEKTKDVATADLADASKKSNEDRRALREIAPSPSTGPSRMAGPKQQANNAQNSGISQNQIQNLPANGRQVDGLMVTTTTRSVGGKTFNLRDGIWYDSAYHGGGTKDAKRGTEKYLKLDAGLRNIADQVGGTVVIVWSGKAYRIK